MALAKAEVAEPTARAEQLGVDCLTIVGASHRNLKNIDVAIPLGTLTAVTGPSGCGKSSLINDVLYNSLSRRLHRTTAIPGAHQKIEGLVHINKVIRVDQSPLGNSPTSNPATYTGAFELIRELFANLPDARVRGFTSRRFSFNVSGGRCEACQGNGQICIEMHFLPDVWVPCEACRGRRYNEETLAVQFHGHSINDVLEMSAAQAAHLFRNISKIQRIVSTLCDVGLDYVRLGQSAPTLSGGEAQRVKLAAELSRPDTGRTLYLLDEPTTGLHFDDLAKLLDVLHRLVDLGNSVVVIEHNLDLIKHADWVIELGPEAGSAGGYLVAAGTPEMLADYARRAAGNPQMLRSHTGEFLAEVLARDPYGERRSSRAPAPLNWGANDEVRDSAPLTAMPWETDGRLWHTVTRVSRDGQSVRWDGQLLARVVDFIQDHGDFAETRWNERSVVEISGHQKSQGWFLHALTGETWLLKLKFRVRRNTFLANELREQIPLKTLNELDEIPRYSNEPRIKVSTSVRGWQEVEIQAHSMEELDRPAFWQFLERAIESFEQKRERVELRLDDQTPWAKLGKRWHLLPKGFGPGKTPRWDFPALEALFDLLGKVEPSGQFTWNNKQVVHFFVPQQKGPWISVQTKKPDAIWLHLSGPTNGMALGAVADDFPGCTLGRAGGDVETIRLPLKSMTQVRGKKLRALLEQHLAGLLVG